MAARSAPPPAPVAQARTFDSPLGRLLAVSCGGGVAALDFATSEGTLEASQARVAERLGARVVRAEPGLRGADGRSLRRLAHWIDAYFARDFGRLPEVPLTLVGSTFELAVWRALETVGLGQRASYGQIAAAVGCRSARAVGGAVGRNPMAIVVPCHRVVGASGELTGYGGGLDRKRWLLDHETGASRPSVAPFGVLFVAAAMARRSRARTRPSSRT